MSVPTTVLCILDGFGLNPRSDGNAIAKANTPHFDKLWEEYPHETLCTFGERVGLPEGQMGNSEVGHLNIGAGRVVEQWLVRIQRELRDGVLQTAHEVSRFLSAVPENGRIHVVGLYSDGGVHSHLKHIDQVIQTLADHYHREVLVHLITDGRDTSPTSAKNYVEHFLATFRGNARVTLCSIAGRFFAMDRDNRWERVEQAFEAFFTSEEKTSSLPLEYIEESYAQGTTDEFLIPCSFAPSALRKEDGVVFCNFRADRMREIVHAVGDPRFQHFPRTAHVSSPEKLLCFTRYDESFPYPILFSPIEITNHLGEVVSAAGLRQLRTAETEKYPHVTYFFNGGREEPSQGEERKLVPSPRDVKTYDEKPEMSAFPVKDIVLEGIRSKSFGFIVVNFANCDMVGHTGVFDAAVKAVETVDACLGEILETLQECGGQALIIADHGNAEQMIDYDTGLPHTAHTTYPVPVVLFAPGLKKTLRPSGSLCDVAPTILSLLGLEQPKEMTGTSLLR
ncbi:MAG: 2,3-bisphosphoglycerate-independent phosphoglycerate mutase [Bdellovibrionales bacterium]|nr:2,3-bisphosphoglycerate-independent phosphoglycerate mutase [Bdellovibrionales bacterium]